MNQTEQQEFIELVIFTALGVVSMAIVLITFFYYSRKKITQFELTKKDQEIAHQQELILTVVNTQENERKRIAQDLHDEISSKLNIVSLNAYILQNENSNQEEKENSLKSIISNTKNAIENSRTIAHNLYPPVLEKFGLDQAIRELVYEINQLRKITVTYENQTKLNELNTNHQVHFFRIIQELLNNSIKHSQCTHIEIIIRKEREKTVVIYTDDGIGITRQNEKIGLGMHNIETRIKALSGIYFMNNDAKGFHLEFNF